MISLRVGLMAVAALFVMGATEPDREAGREPAEDPSDIERLTADRLETFQSEAEFLSYVRGVRAASRRRGFWWARHGGVQWARSDFESAEPCPPELAPCGPAQDEESVVVTGMRASVQTATESSNGSITNNQTSGVDEGDIVKRWGQFLIVLQDGRLFSIDTRAPDPAGPYGLALADRVDIYRKAGADTWYDEMLVYENRILITGYTYEHDATEISVFTIDEAGKMAREAVFFVSSNDYYDVENYASRIVNGNLVFYTPTFLRSINPEEPVIWPFVRRLNAFDEDDEALSPGAFLFNALNIYRPLLPSYAPAIHTVSVCPLGELRAGDELACRSSAFVGPERREFFVSNTDVFLWTTPSAMEERRGSIDCRVSSRFDASPQGMLYRVPLSGAAPSAMTIRGRPRDQFALQATESDFHALLIWNPAHCYAESLSVRFFSAPFTGFSTKPGAADARRYVDAPPPLAEDFENRFTDEYVVYGGRSSYYSAPPRNGEGGNARIVALPIHAPTQSTLLEAPHNVIRAERTGKDIVLTGYRNAQGLSISVIDLRRTPRLVDTAVLLGRYESEGRSHAFNSVIDAQGAGLIGLPTVTGTHEAGRWWDWSEQSDLSFLAVDRARRLRTLGELTASEEAVDESYECSVSCVDWYGNARAIFMDGRIFALSGSELIEGQRTRQGIREIRRLNVTTPAAR